MRYLLKNVEAMLIAGLGSAVLMTGAAAMAQEKKDPATAEGASDSAPLDEDMTTPEDAATAADDTADAIDPNAPDPVLDGSSAGTPAVEEGAPAS
jgi:hypothetical protein